MALTSVIEAELARTIPLIEADLSQARLIKSRIDSLQEPHDERKKKELASKKEEVSSNILHLEAELQYVPILQKAFSMKEGISEIYLYVPPGSQDYWLHIYINKGISIVDVGPKPDFDILVPNPKIVDGKTGIAFYNQGQVENHLRQVEATFLESIVGSNVRIFGGHSNQDYKDLRNKTSFYSPR